MLLIYTIIVIFIISSCIFLLTFKPNNDKNINDYNYNDTIKRDTIIKYKNENKSTFRDTYNSSRMNSSSFRRRGY